MHAHSPRMAHAFGFAPRGSTDESIHKEGAVPQGRLPPLLSGDIVIRWLDADLGAQQLDEGGDPGRMRRPGRSRDQIAVHHRVGGRGVESVFGNFSF